MPEITESEQVKSIAYCGLICALCFRAKECAGCKETNCLCDADCSDAGCYQKTCCQTKGLSGCWECKQLRACTQGIYAEGEKSKIKAFAISIAEDGPERFIRNISACRSRGLSVEKGKDFDNRTIGNVMSLVRKGSFGVDLYDSCPDYTGATISLRLIRESDTDALLSCYSDEKAIPLFNSDNCHGDTFSYQTRERMQQAVDFWIYSYRNRYFIRWTILDNATGTPVGTIEMFRRCVDDENNNVGVLRIDLRSAFETTRVIMDILSIAKNEFFDAFDVETIITKAIPTAVTRIQTLKKAGFAPHSRPLLTYGDYWALSSIEIF